MHGDLKPSNLGISDDGDLFVFDFEACQNLAAPGAARRRIAYTPHYAAPEVKDGTSDVFPATADMFSLGIVLQEIAVSSRMLRVLCID